MREGRGSRLVARLIAGGIFRRIHTEGIDPAALDGPVIVIASHFGGFADPVLLLGVAPRTPRFLAKATLWDAGWLAPVLNMLRAIPVHRAQDGATSGNVWTFEAASEALAARQPVAIFPEGFANDDPTLHPLKTGAARLALDAKAAGVDGLHVVPMCARYERKTRLRTDVWFRQGPALAIDELVSTPAPTSEDHQAVRSITVRFTEALEAIAAPAPPSPGPRALPAVVLAVPALIGFAMNVVPLAIVAGGRKLRDAPVKEVTINVFVAPVVFPLAWLAWLVAGWAARGAAAGVLAAGAAIAGSLCLAEWWRAIRGRI